MRPRPGHAGCDTNKLICILCNVAYVDLELNMGTQCIDWLVEASPADRSGTGRVGLNP